MINLTTCNRSDFVKAYQELTKENKALKAKLEVYEGAPQTNEEAEIEFQKFWKAYGCKGNIKSARTKWFNLPKTKKKLAMDKVVAYVKSTPEKRFRKGGESWLYNECWNDEIVEAAQPYGRPPAVRAMTSIIEDNRTEDKRIEEADKLREANQAKGRSVRDMIK